MAKAKKVKDLDTNKAEVTSNNPNTESIQTPTAKVDSITIIEPTEQQPVEIGTVEYEQKVADNNAARLKQYLDAGYTNKVGDVYLYSPTGVRSKVKYDGSLGDWSEQFVSVGSQPNTISSNDTNTGTPVTSTVQDKPGSWNANVNFNQYGDDSSPDKQAESLGGTNAKYEGEGVKTSNLEYDPNITTKDLDPNYLYGEDARQQNRQEAGYIARRNDMIASALYNEGKLTKEDVAYFLSNQPDWENSTVLDRANTVDSVWKRLGQIKGEQDTQEDVDTSNMEETLGESTAGKIYGKNTADSGDVTEGIDTLEDANSAFKLMNEKRVSNVKAILTMSPETIGTSLYTGTFLYGEQALLDFQRFYPEQYNAAMQEYKRLMAQDNATTIANGEGNIVTSSDKTDTINSNTTYAVNNSSSSVSATQLLKSIDSILESNDTAKSANDLMGSIEKDMATLKNRLQNLRKEANTVFKGDAPDYLVRAYMNNKSQEIQNQLSILEDRYNAAYDRYKTEMSNAQREAEYELKKDSLAIERYKAENTSTTSDSTDSKYSVAERNNNPTNMTVDFLKIMGAELGVDYEVSSDSFINSNGGRQYYGKLIGDPIETTIKILDRAVANGMNPFTTTSWSYINNLGLTKDKWIKMSQEDKEKMINKWVAYEGGSIDNMEYYVNQGGVDNINTEGSNDIYMEWTDYDYTRFEQFKDATSQSVKETIAAEYGTTVKGMGDIVRKALSDKEKANSGDGTYEFGYDEELGYNPVHEEIYRLINSGKISESGMKIQAERMGISIEELGRRADNYKRRPIENSKGVTYDLSIRPLYEKYLSADYSPGWLTTTAASTMQTEDEFGESARAYKADLDAGLIDVVEENAVISQYAYGILEKFASLYNHIDKDEDGDVNFNFLGFGYTYPYDLWNQIRESLTLESMVAARDSDIGFGQVTEAEWEMLRKSASAIGNAWRTRDTNINNEFPKMINALWNKAYGRDITSSEWRDFRDAQKIKDNWMDNEDVLVKKEDQKKTSTTQGIGAVNTGNQLTGAANTGSTSSSSWLNI